MHETKTRKLHALSEAADHYDRDLMLAACEADLAEALGWHPCDLRVSWAEMLEQVRLDAANRTREIEAMKVPYEDQFTKG